MSFDEIIEKYRIRIAAAQSKKDELEKIILEIDKLEYSGSNRPISIDDKERILSGLRKTPLIEHRNFSFETTLSAQDNIDYLKLIEKTIQTLEGKKNG